MGQTRYIYQNFAELLAAAAPASSTSSRPTEYSPPPKLPGHRRRAPRDLQASLPDATGVIVAGLLREGALIEISAIAGYPPSHDLGGATSYVLYGAACVPSPRREGRAHVTRIVRSGRGTPTDYASPRTYVPLGVCGMPESWDFVVFGLAMGLPLVRIHAPAAMTADTSA